MFKKIVLVAVLLTIAALVFAAAGKKSVKSPENTTRVKINGKVFNLEVTESDEAKSKGLSNRESMKDYNGMIFKFKEKGIYSFWMKDMKFPLDFIWLEGTEIKDLVEDAPVPLNTYPENLVIITPKVPIDSVIEVNAGIIRELGIKVGDKVEFLDLNGR